MHTSVPDETASLLVRLMHIVETVQSETRISSTNDMYSCTGVLRNAAIVVSGLMPLPSPGTRPAGARARAADPGPAGARARAAGPGQLGGGCACAPTCCFHPPE